MTNIRNWPNIAGHIHAEETTTTLVAATKIGSITLPTNTVWQIKAEIVGRLRNGPPTTEFALWYLKGLFTHLAGAGASQTGVTVFWKQTNLAAILWSAVFNSNGDDVEIKATSGVAETIDWSCIIHGNQIGSLA